MMPLQLLPAKTFYKVDIREYTEYETTSTWSLISKIWHVAIGKTSASPYLTCKIETFRRKQEDSTVEQSEGLLWAKLAMITDDVTLLLDSYGQPREILNLKELQKKAHATCMNIRETFDGELIDNLLANKETLYNDASLLLTELSAYKQFGLLTTGLYNNDSNTLVRDNTFHFHVEPFKTGILERFTPDHTDEEGLIHFSMQGSVKNPVENMPKVSVYGGKFIFENETNIIRKANVEIEYSGQDYRKNRTYALQMLSDKDMEYL